MITCRKCGHKLPPGSVFCDKCGEPVVKKLARKQDAGTKDNASKGKMMIAAAIALILVVFALIMAFSPGSREKARDENSPETYEERISAMTSRVTPEQYEKLDFGMSYEEVVALLGEEGAGRYSDEYVWPGEYFDRAEYTYDAPRVELRFGHTQKVIEIKEYNVLDGAEIYNTKKADEEELILDDEKLSSLRARMSYAEIAEIIGRDGVLIESYSDKTGNETKTYRWKYYDGNESSSYEKDLTITFFNDKADRNKWDEWGE